MPDRTPSTIEALSDFLEGITTDDAEAMQLAAELLVGVAIRTSTVATVAAATAPSHIAVAASVHAHGLASWAVSNAIHVSRAALEQALQDEGAGQGQVAHQPREDKRTTATRRPTARRDRRKR